MTTEQQEKNGTAIVRTSPKSAQLEAWEIRNRQALALSASTLVPQAYQGNAANCMIAMEMAERTGASVMMVMQNLHIIHGRPGWSAAFLIATVNSAGRFTPLRPRYQGQEGTDDWGCRAVAKDKITGEELVGTLITIRLAKAEGWATKNGSKWATMPEQMLWYRAAAFWTRAYAPELSLGMQTAEEIADVVAVAEVPKAIAPGDTKALEAELIGDTPTREVVDAETGEVVRK